MGIDLQFFRLNGDRHLHGDPRYEDGYLESFGLGYDAWESTYSSLDENATEVTKQPPHRDTLHGTTSIIGLLSLVTTLAQCGDYHAAARVFRLSKKLSGPNIDYEGIAEPVVYFEFSR